MKRRFLTFWIFAPLFFAPLALASEVVPDFSLTNQDNKAIKIHDYKGKYLFLTFIFSRCPQDEMCPLTMRKSKALLKAWQKRFPKKPLQVLAVTLDPEVDTPTVLKEFGLKHNLNFKDFSLATGNPQVVEAFAREFNVIGFPSPSGLLTHNMKNILIGPDLREIKQFKENEWEINEVLNAINPAPKS